MQLAEDMGVMTNLSGRSSMMNCLDTMLSLMFGVFVFVPSGDTIAVALLEAMASGVTPVVSDLPSPRECVRDGVNGYIVPVRDIDATAQAITKLLKDKGLRESFTKRNREWVIQNADWNKNMKKVEELYYELVNKN